MKIWKEVSPYSGQSMEEDAPANAAGGGAIAGLGVDKPGYPGSGEPGVKKKKKKETLIDGRTKAYRQHRERLERSRIKRQEAAQKRSKFAENVLDGIAEFGIENHIEERVGYKSATGPKFKSSKEAEDKVRADMKAGKDASWYIDDKMGAGQKWAKNSPLWHEVIKYQKGRK